VSSAVAIPGPTRRRWLRIAAQIAAAAVAGGFALSFLGRLSTNSPSGHWETPLPPVLLGAIIGLTYGLLGVGLVLVYRSNRIVNFAHGEIGAFGASFFGLAVTRWHVPYWVAFPFGLAVGGAVAALAEVAVIRRLRKAPRLMSIVATLGVGQLLVGLALSINTTAQAGFLYPEPSGLPSFRIGGLLVTPAYTGMLLFGPVLVVGLIVFLRRSRYGLALRAAASAPDTARMAGVFASRMSSLAWALAGGLSAFTAIMTQPTQGFSGAQAFGPNLLLRALAAAAIGRMSNLAGALIAGVGIGVLEQLLLWNYSQAGLVSVVLFGVILLALLIQRGRVGREEEERGSWAAVQALRPVPEKLREIWLIRHLGAVVGLLALAGAVALPLVIAHSAAVTLSGIFALVIVGLSLGIVTGLGGQLSLGQFGVAAIAGVVSYFVTSHGGHFAVAFIYGGLASAVVSLILGLPALRSRGLMLTVTTLAFALVTSAWLLQQPWMLESGVTPNRPAVFGISLDSGRTYYLFALAMLVVAMAISRGVRRGGLGRVLIAVRDNEDNARAFTVRASLLKAQAFLLAGFLAGVGGAVYMHSLARVTYASFPTLTSIQLATMVVIGGLGILSGPLLGAMLVLALPAFVGLDAAGVAASSFGQLLIILYLPGGIASVIEPLRNYVVRFLGRRAGVDVDAAYASASPTGQGDGAVRRTPMAVRELASGRPRRRPPGTVLLEATDLEKSFGGVRAVDGVSLRIRAGETVGLIGPNGAGKTTTFELLSGFLRPDRGRVWFEGQDVTGLGPEARGHLGLIRSFQDSALFPTMTVSDAVAVALERTAPTGFLTSIAGMSGGERRKQREARDIVALMGLSRYQDMQIQELSTGTRRITEIACLVATRPTLLLFDEPSTGIAQRETEALGSVIGEIKDALGVTLVVIEHDMPLIMGLADRIIAMADGKIIASGPPEVVQHDPQVVEAYLGGSPGAIQRSGSSARRDTHTVPRRKEAAVAAHHPARGRK
jgi:ABC-type branched-subunit amino acid transport system ATPase component/ABC-type branched-subunit amino acid transport system permease subunit